MHFFLISCLMLVIGFVQAHFQMQFPVPRGPFVDDAEVKVCDGYDTVGTRTNFPLTNPLIRLNSEHAKATIKIQVSTSPDNTVKNFNLLGFFQSNTTGEICIPFKFPMNFTDGLNVTTHVVFDGGDGLLFQCADLTLNSTAQVSQADMSNCATASPASASTSDATTLDMNFVWVGLLGVAYAAL